MVQDVDLLFIFYKRGVNLISFADYLIWILIIAVR